jgi:DNA ligase (NAD+)
MGEIYNEAFINFLGELYDIRRRAGEPFSAQAYKKAQEIIMTYPDDITDPSKQLKGMNGIGSAIMLKFEEYVKNKKVAALEKERANPLNLFTTIYGVGPKKAKEIVGKGITTIEQLRQHEELLNDSQKIGLKYFDDINQRIPRVEIDEFEKHFRNIFDSVAPTGSSFEIVGSYRRGAQNSGDIDIIITNKENNKDAFEKVLDVMMKDKIITEVLSRGKTKSLTLVQIKKDGPIRRVDFLYSSPDEYAFAILYFTGSKIFNTVVRQRATDLGYTLNEHELSYKVKGKKGGKIEQDFPTEESILNFLGIKYVKPEERIDGRSIKLIKTQKHDNEDMVCYEADELDDEALLSALESTYDKIPLDDDDDDDEETMALEALEALEAQESKSEVIKVKKNKTLKKALSPSEVDIVEKLKTDGIMVLKMMTETELSNLIHAANTAYYCDDKPLMSDNLYDMVREYVLEKYPENKTALEGHKCDTMVKNKVKLPYELWSMDKIKPTTEALKKWTKNFKGPYVVSAKLDGISALYMVKDGVGTLYTRGNGTMGQDISPLIPYLIGKNFAKDVAIRGEIIISKEVFQKKYAEKFSNPRNFVAGIVNKKTIESAIVNDLEFVPYEVIQPVMRPSEQMKFLDLWNAGGVQYMVKKEISNEILSEILLDWREKYMYEIDGVIVVNDEIYSRPKKNPEYAVAFKMVISDQVVEAKVVDVLWSPSKDGYLKPRVQIEPVILGGAKIEYATGFNAQFIKDNKIGIGAIVSIIRSGDVIPHIISVVIPAETTKMPAVSYKWNETGVDAILDGEDDATVREKNITGFFKGIEVDGLGPGNVKRIIAAGYKTVPAIIAMSKADFLKVDGFKEKSANKLYNGIREKVDAASLCELMAASNIFGRGFGNRRLVSILKVYPDILRSEESVEQKIQMLTKVDGIATKTAGHFVKKIPEFLDFMNQGGLEKKLDVVDEMDEMDEVDGNAMGMDIEHPLYGKKIVFTGFRDKVLLEKIKAVGAEEGGNVSKNTFAVLVKDLEEQTGKTEQARKLDIMLMTPDMFEEKFLK